jgi:ferritin-like metal-binding protein YciE
MASQKSTKQAPGPEDLLLTELRDIYSAEKQLTRALPRLGKAVESDKLRSMLDRRLQEGHRLTEELERAFEEMDVTPGRQKNVAAEGLIADAQENVQEIQAGPALDAVLVGAVQKTEHYCIAAWGTAKSFAKAVGQKSVVGAMERALEEGRSFDKELTQIAEKEITPELVRGAGRSSEREARA